MAEQQSFFADPETQDAILDMAAGVAGSFGVGSIVTVPATVVAKLVIRMADAGVEIPSNIDLTALQQELRSLGELPG
jgi:hypothetical protein